MERWGSIPKEMRDEEESIHEGKPQEEVDPVRLFMLVLEMSSRPRSEVPMYDGILNVEELIDSINTIDKYFDYEEFHEAKNVKFGVTKLRGHTSI